MSKTKWYGCLGFLSLLGLVGVLTPQREFLSFFAFAVDFEYFFLPSDEMVEQYMNRSAARGFVAGMLVMAAVTVGSLLIGQQSSPALLTGLRCRMGGSGYSAGAVGGLLRLPGETGGGGMIRNRIKEYRARHNMKQEELARLVGVRRETIGNLEKGRYNPSLVLAWNIAQVFGVSIEEIFTVEPEQQDRP